MTGLTAALAVADTALSLLASVGRYVCESKCLWVHRHVHGSRRPRLVGLERAPHAYGIRPVLCRVQVPPLGLLPVLRTNRMPVSEDGSYPHAPGP